MKHLLFALVAMAVAGIARRTAESRATELPVSVLRAVRLPDEWSRIAALGFDAVVADALWIRFMQRLPLRPAGPELGAALASDLQTVIALDPQFRSAYVHGSVLLSVLGDEPCAALEVATLGESRFPEDWRLPFQAGYTCFVELSDEACAARHMQKAASIEGSPRWLPALVARLLSGAGEAEAAIDYLRAQVATASDPRLKERFSERLNDALLTRDLRSLDLARRRYQREQGEPPPSLDALVTAGLLDAIPVEPFGGRYELVGGRIRSTSGRGELTAGVLEALTDTKFLELRVVARAGEYLSDMPMAVLAPGAARLAARASDAAAALEALELMARLEEDPGRLARLRVLQARSILQLDLLRLKRAQLAWLQAHGRAPSLEELLAATGVHATDPFGSPYRMDGGIPSSDTANAPITFVKQSSGRRIQESERCN